jgi:hypothetical protein
VSPDEGRHRRGQGYEVSKVIGSACVGGGGNLNNE